jgi:hypothetical protein
MRKSKLTQVIVSILLVFLIIVCNGVYFYFFEGFSVMQAIRQVRQEYSFLVILLPFGFILAALVVLTSKIIIRKKKP